MEKLAINGGAPVREVPLSYGRQYIDEADIQAVAETLRSDYLTCGPRTEALEKSFVQLPEQNTALQSQTAPPHCISPHLQQELGRETK